MQPNMQLVVKSGVTTAWFHWMGSGRSTRMPRPSRTAAKWSSCSFARSTVSKGRGPHRPRMALSSGIFASVAGSVGGMQVWSARPRMMWRSGSKSFQELTTVLLIRGLRSRVVAGGKPGQYPACGVPDPEGAPCAPPLARIASTAALAADARSRASLAMVTKEKPRSTISLA